MAGRGDGRGDGYEVGVESVGKSVVESVEEGAGVVPVGAAEGSEWTADSRFCADVYNNPTKSVSLSVEKIAKMRDFAAIDFETANSQRTSVCSVGVVVVRDGVIADSIYRLIRPRPNFYSRFTTAIHGLTREDTDSAPAFDEVWREIAPRIEGLPLVAHNSPFDEGCLRAAFDLYGMPYPGYTFYCTCRASRQIFGQQLPNHQLHTVAAACGYDLQNHHHALADAEACARIALRIL